MGLAGTQSETMKPLLIQLMNLLHACKSADALVIREFLAKHTADETFQRRAKAVMESWRVKQDFETAWMKRGNNDRR